MPTAPLLPDQLPDQLPSAPPPPPSSQVSEEVNKKTEVFVQEEGLVTPLKPLTEGQLYGLCKGQNLEGSCQEFEDRWVGVVLNSFS